MSILIPLILCTSAQAQPSPEPAAFVRLPVNVSIVPGVSIGDAVSSAARAGITNSLSLNVLAGRSSQLNGVEFGTLWNAYTGAVNGAQFSGVVNTNGGDVRGAQFAGALNAVRGDIRGAQLAGAFNLAQGDVHGAQFSGAVSHAGGRAGAQFSGALSVAGDIDAVQMSGAVNIARDAVRGVQFGGLLNVATRVRGAQVGVINVASEHTGVPVGLLSYVRSVGLRYDVWSDETGLITTAVRSGNRRISNYLGLAARPGAGQPQWSIVAGLGTEVPVIRRSYAAFELLQYGALRKDGWNNYSKLRLLGGFELGGHVALFAGPTFNAFISKDAEEAGFIPWSVYEGELGTAQVRLWPGFTYGVRLSPRAL